MKPSLLGLLGGAAFGAVLGWLAATLARSWPYCLVAGLLAVAVLAQQPPVVAMACFGGVFGLIHAWRRTL